MQSLVCKVNSKTFIGTWSRCTFTIKQNISTTFLLCWQHDFLCRGEGCSRNEFRCPINYFNKIPGRTRVIWYCWRTYKKLFTRNPTKNYQSPSQVQAEKNLLLKSMLNKTKTIFFLLNTLGYLSYKKTPTPNSIPP